MSNVMRATCVADSRKCVVLSSVRRYRHVSRRDGDKKRRFSRLGEEPNGNAPPRVYDRVDTSSECLLGVFIKDSAAEAAHKRATTATTSLANFRKRSARARARTYAAVLRSWPAAATAAGVPSLRVPLPLPRYRTRIIPPPIPSTTV